MKFFDKSALLGVTSGSGLMLLLDWNNNATLVIQIVFTLAYLYNVKGET